MVCHLNGDLNTTIKHELMCDQFPTIWTEFIDPLGKKTIIGGFYMEWTRDGHNSEEAQWSGSSFEPNTQTFRDINATVS